jgi:hypothetical protein
MENPGQGRSARIYLPVLKFSHSRRKIQTLVVYLACLWNLLGMAILPGYVCPI